MGAAVDWVSLIARAWEARANAHAPYSGFLVGAALSDKTGRVFSGCNVENVSLGMTMCAERNAVGAAIAAGCRDFAALAIVAESDEPIVPCGACRQVLAEFQPALEIHSVGRNGVLASWTLEELLPAPFVRF